MNLESDFGIKNRLDFVNEKLRGKRIKKLSRAESKSVMVEFEDGSMGRIEVLNEDDGESYLSVMPPNNLSEAYRKSFGENVKVDSGLKALDVPRLVVPSEGSGDSIGYDDLPDTLEYLSAENSWARYYEVIDKTTGKAPNDLGHPVYLNTKEGFYIDMDMDRNSKICFRQNLQISKIPR